MKNEVAFDVVIYISQPLCHLQQRQEDVDYIAARACICICESSFCSLVVNVKTLQMMI